MKEFTAGTLIMLLMCMMLGRITGDEIAHSRLTDIQFVIQDFTEEVKEAGCADPDPVYEASGADGGFADTGRLKEKIASELDLTGEEKDGIHVYFSRNGIPANRGSIIEYEITVPLPREARAGSAARGKIQKHSYRGRIASEYVAYDMQSDTGEDDMYAGTEMTE